MICVVTGHPALPYVLKRTAPAGVRLHAPETSQRRAGQGETLYRITIRPGGIAREAAAMVLPGWIAGQLEAYGARRLSVNGKRIPPGDFAAIRRAISAAVKRIMPLRRPRSA